MPPDDSPISVLRTVRPHAVTAPIDWIGNARKSLQETTTASPEKKQLIKDLLASPKHSTEPHLLSSPYVSPVVIQHLALCGADIRETLKETLSKFGKPRGPHRNFAYDFKGLQTDTRVFESAVARIEHGCWPIKEGKFQILIKSASRSLTGKLNPASKLRLQHITTARIQKLEGIHSMIQSHTTSMYKKYLETRIERLKLLDPILQSETPSKYISDAIPFVMKTDIAKLIPSVSGSDEPTLISTILRKRASDAVRTLLVTTLLAGPYQRGSLLTEAPYYLRDPLRE